MKYAFKILLFCIVLCNQLFSADPEPMSSDDIVAQARELGYVPVTDFTDEQLDRILQESEQRLAQAKERDDKEIENVGGLALQA